MKKKIHHLTVLAAPLPRPYEHWEPTDPFDFKNCSIYQDLDGIRCCLYFYNGKWQFTAFNCIENSEPACFYDPAFRQTFGSLFQKVWVLQLILFFF